MPTPADQMHIFNRKSLAKALDAIQPTSIPNFQRIQKTLQKWDKPIDIRSLNKAKEESLRNSFFSDIFQTVLGYSGRAAAGEWTIDFETKAITDRTKCDATLGFFSPASSDVRVAVELKGPAVDLDAKQYRQNDRLTPVEQAFSYVPKFGKNCRWVVVSNVKEIRLYNSRSSGEYEHFKVIDLAKWPELRRFLFLLSQDNLIDADESIVDRRYADNAEDEKAITGQFYGEYRATRLKLFGHLRAKNKGTDELLLLEKTQKLLDRLIFVRFCEDWGLLPERSLIDVIDRAKKSFGQDKVWKEFKVFFEAINSGNPKPPKIHKFNGGLFAKDADLDRLKIDDEVFDSWVGLAKYDFLSELDVNILGHVFEQSISDIEELKAEIRGQKKASVSKAEKGQEKRKREGVYYTPKHITQYIVEAAIGAWLEEVKQKLGVDRLPELTPRDFQTIKLVAPNSKAKSNLIKSNLNVKKHISFWEAFRDELRAVRVLDPACGSGAFLNQAFDYLRRQGELVNETLERLRGGQRDIFDLSRHILSKNLYGVDVNLESVELTKLSLWLKTANKYSELTTLDDNIRWGNSLVDDPDVAEKDFDWNSEFEAIMEDGGFDVIIGNPPYDVLSEKETGIKDVAALVAYIKADDVLSRSVKGKNNLYKLFICKAVSLLKDGGYLSYIVPMSLQGDEQAASVREFLFENVRFVSVDSFPQKDDASRRVFEDAKLSTTVFCVTKQSEDSVFKVRIHPGKYFETPWDGALAVTKAELEAFDPENRTIPCCTNADWKLVQQVIKLPYFRRLGNFATQYQGEVNETNCKRFLSEDSDGATVLRGANITCYCVRDASQGEDLSLDDVAFMEAARKGTKAYHHKERRVGFQRSAPQNNFRRLIAAPIAKGDYCFDTVSYVTESSAKIDLDVLLILLNSKFYDWWFSVTSTNSKVNEYQFDNLPAVAVSKVANDPLASFVAKREWAEFAAALGKAIAKSQKVPTAAYDALAAISKEIQKIEKQRELSSRRERATLAPASLILQRYADAIIYRCGVPLKSRQVAGRESGVAPRCPDRLSRGHRQPSAEPLGAVLRRRLPSERLVRARLVVRANPRAHGALDLRGILPVL